MSGRQRATHIKKEKFCKHLSKCGNVSTAARQAGVSRQYVYKLRNNDPGFEASWTEAMDTFLDGLEAEVYRRGVEGVRKPLAHKGLLTGDYVTEYSDSLLMFYLKRYRPEFRENQLQQVPVQQPNQHLHLHMPVHKPPRPTTMAEWEAQVREAREARLALAREAQDASPQAGDPAPVEPADLVPAESSDPRVPVLVNVSPNNGGNGHG